MIQKIISIICDGCGCGINHYPGYTKGEAIATAKSGGIIFKGKNQFCNKRCKRKFEQTSKDCEI